MNERTPEKIIKFIRFFSLLPLFATSFCQDYFIKVDTEQEMGEWWVDEFVQEPLLDMDILWVIDNSGSMVEEVENLSTSIETFVHYISDLHIRYQIGIVTTDMTSDGGVLVGIPQIVTPELADPADALSSNAMVGTGGSAVEQGLLSMKTALSPPLIDNENRGFLREEASLTVLVFSDDDDNSPGDVEDYALFLDSLKGEGREDLTTLYSVTGDRKTGCNGEYGRANPGERYIDVAEMTGGSFFSICASDFSPLLEELARRSIILGNEFPLSFQPIEETITILVDGKKIEAEERWHFDKNSNKVVFDGDPPDIGSRIKIIYMIVR